ncbi:MAG: aminotransferase class I/II-fold pyridoxal phosphate-dependent enzyme [Sphingobacteriaceae bacterium]|nr:aminotransferase class I/II-fold pyridoxal phosphate-dependent enzyme [Sphingobacteriaceae bacterium]
MELKSKLPGIGTSIFAIMSGLAREHNAINLSQGFPDFDCDKNLLSLCQKYMNAGFNQYSPMPGVIQLRERVAEILETCYQAVYSPDTEITITAGATQGIFTAVSAFVKPGDEVIVFEPCYDSYIPSIETNGGKAVKIKMLAPEFKINWADVKSAINACTKMIIINTPHNPTGILLKQEDLIALELLVKGKNIIVVSDEVYEHIVFDDRSHQSVARYPTLANQSFIVSSFGKTIHTTGWKIGYVAARKELMNEFRKVHQFLVFSVNHPFQLGIADYLSDKNNYLDLKNFYEQKRNLFLKLTSGSRLKPIIAEGTYFQLMSFKAISSENDMDLAIRLTKEKGIATVPLSAFYAEHTDPSILRFCFAKKDETLEQAAEIINKL